jgi:hypothetical protein
MIGLRVVLFGFICMVVLLLLMLAPLWLRSLRAVIKTAPPPPTNPDREDEEPRDFVEGEFRHIDTP